jgi:transcription elongation factor Elf1
MSFLEDKYIQLASGSLQQFKSKGNGVHQFRCPYCGDSAKSKTKSRGYVYEKQNNVFFRCHNCGRGTTFQKLLKHIDLDLYNEYIAEKFNSKYQKHNITKKTVKVKIENQDVLNGIQSLIELDSNHPAIKYVQDRKLPTSSYYDIYYIDDINTISNKIPKYKDTKFDTKNRIIFPFRDMQGNITHLQARSIEPIKKAHRFITLELIKDVNKIFGLDRLNFNEVVFVVESPIDSLFLDNSVAMAGADVNLEHFNPANTIIIYDNERTDEILNRIKNVLVKGYRVCFWDSDVVENDINDMMINGRFTNTDELRNYILLHSKSKLSGDLALHKYIKRI